MQRLSRFPGFAFPCSRVPGILGTWTRKFCTGMRERRMRESEEIGMLILCSCEEYGTSLKWRTISRQSELSHTHLIVCYVVPREIRRQRQGRGEIFVLDMNEEVTNRRPPPQKKKLYTARVCRGGGYGYCVQSVQC